MSAWKEAPEGDPLKAPEAQELFSDPGKLQALVKSIADTLAAQLQKRGYEEEQIDALFEHLARQAFLLEQADKRLGRWKELARL